MVKIGNMSQISKTIYFRSFTVLLPFILSIYLFPEIRLEFIVLPGTFQGTLDQNDFNPLATNVPQHIDPSQLICKVSDKVSLSKYGMAKSR